jgi:hypothetical protein
MRRSSLAGILAVAFCLLGAGVLLAQEEPAAATQTSEEVAIAAENAMAEMSAQEATAVASAQESDSASIAGPDAKVPEWVWGEVTSVDKDNAQFEIKHLDYETYEEVTKVIKANEKTLFENAGAVGDLKIGDKVTIDYMTKDGAAVAELVVLEKTGAAGVSESADEPVVPAEDEAVSAEAEPSAPAPAASTAPVEASVPAAPTA